MNCAPKAMESTTVGSSTIEQAPFVAQARVDVEPAEPKRALSLAVNIRRALSDPVDVAKPRG